MRILDDILSALFTDAFFRDYAIGEKDLTTRKLVEQLLYNLERPLKDPSKLPHIGILTILSKLKFMEIYFLKMMWKF